MEDDETRAGRPVERELTRLRTIQQVHALLDQGPDVEGAVARVFGLLGERHRLQPCMLSLLDEATRQVTVAVAAGVSRRGREQARYRLGEGITGRVVLSARPVVVPQVGDEPLYLNRTGAFTPDGEDRAFVCVPVNAGKRTIGALGALTRARDNPTSSTPASSWPWWPG